MVTAGEAPPRVRVRTLSCPSCGASIPDRSFGYARTVACANCTAVLDAADPALGVLQEAQRRISPVQPLIPLGTRGLLREVRWEAIGLQARRIRVDGMAYDWREYVLFNPVHGFRYLTEYDGHWSFVAPLRSLPAVTRHSDRPTAVIGDDTFRHFQTAEAETVFVVGEFPWEVRVGDRVTCADYVDPPRMLSSEVTDEEVTWSLGEYVAAADVYAAFDLGAPPAPRGVYANQPNPAARRFERMVLPGMWALTTVVALVLAWHLLGRWERIFTGAYTVIGSAASEPEPAPFVTDTFVVRGRTTNIALDWAANVHNSWIAVNLALIDPAAGTAVEFERELSYYEGYDGGEHWREGSKRERVYIPSVPAGTYFLRVAPQAAVDQAVSYTLTLTRDVPSWSAPGIAVAALLLPLAVAWWRQRVFEVARWGESDHPMSRSGDSDSDDD